MVSHDLGQAYKSLHVVAERRSRDAVRVRLGISSRVRVCTRTSPPHSQKRFLYYYYFDKCAVVCVVPCVVVCVVVCVVDCPRALYPSGLRCVVVCVVGCVVTRVVRCVVAMVKRRYSSDAVRPSDAVSGGGPAAVRRARTGGSTGPQRSGGAKGGRRPAGPGGSERRRAGGGWRWLAVMDAGHLGAAVRGGSERKRRRATVGSSARRGTE